MPEARISLLMSNIGLGRPRGGRLNLRLGLINYCLRRALQAPFRECRQLFARAIPSLKSFRGLLFASVATAALSACVTNHARVSQQPDFSHSGASQSAQMLADMSARYKARPDDKTTVLYYAAALRAAGRDMGMFLVYQNNPDTKFPAPKWIPMRVRAG